MASSPASSVIDQASSDNVIFSDFFDCWLAQQDRDLQALHAAVLAASSGDDHHHRHRHHHQQQNDRQHQIQAAAVIDSQARHLVEQVIGHHEYYYRAKAALAHRDVLPMFTRPWTSSTDNLFMWVGGWRPATAFQLLYSECGLQFESHLADYLSLGRLPSLPDLGGLSHSQLEEIDRLQRETIRLEKEISEEEAKAQESIASSQLVSISHSVSQAMRSAEDSGLVESAMEADMKDRREKMVRVLESADKLRLDTMKKVVEMLRPMQAVHFLIAASELLLRVHEFGKSMDFAAGVRRLNRTRSSEF